MKGFAVIVILTLCVFVFIAYAITEQISGY